MVVAIITILFLLFYRISQSMTFFAPPAGEPITSHNPMLVGCGK